MAAELRDHLDAGGLYDPTREHDSCGVAFVATLRGFAGRDIVEAGLTALKKTSKRDDRFPACRSVFVTLVYFTSCVSNNHSVHPSLPSPMRGGEPETVAPDAPDVRSPVTQSSAAHASSFAGATPDTTYLLPFAPP